MTTTWTPTVSDTTWTSARVGRGGWEALQAYTWTQLKVFTWSQLKGLSWTAADRPATTWTAS